jgi:hypothetical protein
MSDKMPSRVPGRHAHAAARGRGADVVWVNRKNGGDALVEAQAYWVA